MEENKQTLYNDELLDILPDGVIIFNISGEVIQQPASSDRTSCAFISQCNDASSNQYPFQIIK